MALGYVQTHLLLLFHLSFCSISPTLSSPTENEAALSPRFVGPRGNGCSKASRCPGREGSATCTEGRCVGLDDRRMMLESVWIHLLQVRRHVISKEYHGSSNDMQHFC